MNVDQMRSCRTGPDCWHWFPNLVQPSVSDVHVFKHRGRLGDVNVSTRLDDGARVVKLQPPPVV